ncbi:uncharacterized protein MYCFIDRAFT_77154 [Pseudocercospora fijiensis CIRAD86]|uniref:Uncharacterized protein n=1 Tax=Pseudocercospora fijiensis (strain CIRAD86) TaxID=383855 RepID=M3AR22_PSEFD|nr:uncharacterized protein MYCFIDRAFT_77154 [Pseudocercospora fijiensis CIRAD86]EME87076.1 hypothetical protein MYCFIDRAFT_77154 [Pseudocercospora fijiensis CIRAD86]
MATNSFIARESCDSKTAPLAYPSTKERLSSFNSRQLYDDADNDSLRQSPHILLIKETTHVELFYDLFFVANLAVFTQIHSVTDERTLEQYICFVYVLWFSWYQVTLYDDEALFNFVLRPWLAPSATLLLFSDMATEEELLENEGQITNGDGRHDSAAHLDPSTTDQERDPPNIGIVPALMEDWPDVNIPLHFDQRVRLLRRDDDSRSNAMMRAIQQQWQDFLRVKDMSAFIAACKVAEWRQPGIHRRPPFIAVFVPEHDLHKLPRVHGEIVRILR